MDDALIERAVEAGAKATYDLLRPPCGPDFYLASVETWAICREEVRTAVTAALVEVETSIKAEALRELVEHCFDENDATVTVGGINTVLVYVCDTIAELTKEEKDFANAAQIRTYVSDQIERGDV